MTDDGDDENGGKIESQWKFRPPPRAVPRESLKICKTLENGDVCRMGENCVQAHSKDELAEWRARWSQRQDQEDKQKRTYSDKILEEILNAENSSVMTTYLSGVQLTCDQKTKVKFASRNSCTIWHFNVRSQKMLKGVSLLEVEHLQHFALTDVARINKDGNMTFVETEDQQCVFGKDNTTATVYRYSFNLKFKTKIFGSFKQTVLLDFGTVEADVVPCSPESDLQIVRDMIISQADTWDSNNSNVINFEPCRERSYTDEVSLLARYPAPQPSKVNMTIAITEPKLSNKNYFDRMHQLLCIEEIEQQTAISGFNAMIKLQLAISYQISASLSQSVTTKYIRPGELFARIELTSELCEDSQAGRLILTSCNSLLLKLNTCTLETNHERKKEKRVKINKKKIWECLVEDTARSVVYIRLPSALVKENKLTHDMKVTAEIQFKLSRMKFAEMHDAIDNMSDLSIIYPDIEESPKIPWTPSSQWCTDLDTRLNPKQKEAIIAITAPLDINLPPIIVHGPYGTGKTFTLGNAIKQLLKVDGNKILVCTHSNSAADLYVKEYLDPVFSEQSISKKLLRLYYHQRWVQTVHPTVQKYCLIETDPISLTRKFKLAELEDLVDRDVVVATLSTSRTLTKLLSRGHFTHILLDEAAQAMETEAIIPLVLATKFTRIVLAGDHMQLEPEVISEFAREKRLNVSLLERLYDRYPMEFSCKILLCENYRSHKIIVDYTSQLFYEQKLVASGTPPAHDSWYPLTFFAARGEDVLDPSSTSYYNTSEVYEVVDRLVELRKNWPISWGKKEVTEIGVVTPYHDQVLRIRSELRKRGLQHISVERVLNVQGKQYRAIFISTVRTRRTCLKLDDNDMSTLDYGFLSSAKLLNTAITRAQSMVAVVGDPVALVSVGKCRKLWEKFLTICEANNNLHGFTLSALTSHLEAIELKKIYGLNPLAQEFVPRIENVAAPRSPHRLPPPVNKPDLWYPPSPSAGIVPPSLINPSYMSYDMMRLHNLSTFSVTATAAAVSRMNFPYRAPPLYVPGMPHSFLPPAAYPPCPYFPPAAIRPPVPIGVAAGMRQGSPVPTTGPFPFLPQSLPTTPTHGRSTLVTTPPNPFGAINNKNQAVHNQLKLENILPSGVDLSIMLKSVDLQKAWYSRLQSMGQFAEAEEFRKLCQNPPPTPPPPLPQKQQCTSSRPTTELKEAETTAPNSPSPSVPQENVVDEDETLESVWDGFQLSLNWSAPPVSSAACALSSVPLYKRGTLHEELNGEDEEEDVAEDCVSSESILTFALEDNNFYNSLLHETPCTKNVTSDILKSRNIQTTSITTNFVENNCGMQTYAGVVRTTPKSTEADTLEKIRYLGTVGSQML